MLGARFVGRAICPNESVKPYEMVAVSSSVCFALFLVWNVGECVFVQWPTFLCLVTCQKCVNWPSPATHQPCPPPTKQKETSPCHKNHIQNWQPQKWQHSSDLASWSNGWHRVTCNMCTSFWILGCCCHRALPHCHCHWCHPCLFQNRAWPLHDLVCHYL